VANLIPHAIRAVLDGERVLIVPHGLDEVRLLRNLGIDAPLPILTRYDWNGLKPYEAQRETAAMLSVERAAYVLNQFGTGKTRAALFAFDYLRSIHRAERMLVAAPLSTLTMTWQNEIRENFPHLRSVVVHGDREQRIQMLEADFDIYIINHDGVRVFWQEILLVRADVVCIDELTAFKNSRAARSKAMAKVIAPAPYRWGMTGAPTPQGPEDAHGQVRLITPDNVPRSFVRWRDKVMLKVSQFKYVPRAGANEIVHEAMSPAVRFERADVVELPPLSILRRHVEMSSKQKDTYEQVMKNLRAQVDEGEVTVANEAVKLNKLLQISSGFVYTTDSAAALLDPKPRLETIDEVMQEAQAKVLIFAPFIAGVDLIHAYLTGIWGLAAFGKITGETSPAKRNEIFDAFRDPSSAMLGIVAHPRTMRNGLNLQAADMIIWGAPYPSLETYEQANARITRPGQTKKQVIVQIIGSPVEAKVYQRLDHRASMQNALLEMFQ
jgi:SNF2 family DNA or RNA helicase